MKYAISDYCVCPISGGELIETDGGLWCAQSQKQYAIRNGIPILLPTYEDEQHRYFECYQEVAINDLKAPLEFGRDYRHNVLLDFIGKGRLKGKKVLDIGSSNATYLQELDADFKVALDLALPYLETIPNADDIARICGDAEFLPFKAGFFDVIIISDVLEHLLNPEKLVEHLVRICDRETRIVVHIPWEENIMSYKNQPYEFTHLRSFNSFTYAQLWRPFHIKRSKATYPNLNEPLILALEGKMPSFIFRFLMESYLHLPAVGIKEYQKRRKLLENLPKHGWWLRYFTRPVFKMFEMRLGRSLAYRLLYGSIKKADYIGRRLPYAK